MALSVTLNGDQTSTSAVTERPHCRVG